MASDLAKKVFNLLKKDILDYGDIDNEKLNKSLRLLAKWRSVLIQNTFIENEGTNLSRGPFSGMEFLESSAEGCHVPKLIGTYEQPLHSYIDMVTRASYAKVINVGCAEGYYAVGFALKMPNTEILAYDINAKAQQACIKLAKKNDVTERVSVFGELAHQNLTETLLNGSLIFCDIEGAEIDLLDPRKATALQSTDIIVESHECLVPGITETLKSRFAQTHNIIEVKDDGMRKLENPPEWFLKFSHLDQLLATWEWRSGPTPWLIMTQK
ncbi:MAG: hypothetical protein P8K27_02175 [Gammaproteobacteria bacterium]|nr:hypothetical protein [Gammaproteobacteria bacterium]